MSTTSSLASACACPPFVVVDLETSGLPPRGGSCNAGFRACILEIGVAVIDAQGQVVAQVDYLVQPPEGEAHFRQAGVSRALEVNGLDPVTVMRQGLTPFAAAHRLYDLLLFARGHYEASWWTAYNLSFETHFLGVPPYDAAFLHAEVGSGECVMEAATEVMGAAGELEARKGQGVRGHAGGYRYPKLVQAVDWLRMRGHPIQWDGSGAGASGGKGVMDAALAGQAMFALMKERGLWG